MLKIDFTNEQVFGFDGPNLCFLGDEIDFKKLAEILLQLTTPGKEFQVDITALNFIEISGENKSVLFESKKGGSSFCLLDLEKDAIIFELDDRVWERLFKIFILLSWKKSTYYLNSFEDLLQDLNLDQECHFICSSEF